MLKLWGALFLCLASLSAQAAHTQARLVLAAETARPGDTLLAGVHLRMDPRWHTYWKNPGGPGIPTPIPWQLTPGGVGKRATEGPPTLNLQREFTHRRKRGGLFPGRQRPV